jgi:hypothetical protein
VLKERLAAKILEIRVLDPALAQSLVGQIIAVLEDREPRHQPRRQGRMTRLVGVDRAELPLQKRPVDRPRQPGERMVKVDDLVEPRAEQVLLARLPALLRLHRKTLRRVLRRRNHTPRFAGIPPAQFARKPPANPQKPANPNIS